jgi:cytochrome c oxidase subunit 2
MDTTGSLFLPPSGSTMAPEVDALMTFILGVCIFFGVVVFGGVIYFSLKYRRQRRSERGAAPSHNDALELAWTILPLILVIIIFFWGFRTYMKMSVVPKDALEVKVTAQKWFWSFSYPEGQTSVSELVVPVGKPIKLLMSSRDVIHSFFVPGFRLKRDVLPNRYSIAWFEATQTGVFDLFCAEYCGSKHSGMLGKVRVVSDREYGDWLAAAGAGGEGLSPAEYGAKLYESKECVTCHSLDGSRGEGPSFLNVFNHEVQLKDGSKIVADENYLRESILNPASKVVAGYQPIMPTYQTLLKDADVDALVAYIKSLSQ